MTKKHSKYRFSILIVWTAVLSIMLFIWSCGDAEKPPEPKSGIKTEQAPAPQSPIPSIIDTYPENGGILRDLNHPIYIIFSEPVKDKEFSFTISPDPGGWEVVWFDDGKEAVLEHNVS